MPLMHAPSRDGRVAATGWSMAALAAAALAWAAVGYEVDVSARGSEPGGAKRAEAGDALSAAAKKGLAVPAQPVSPEPLAAYRATLERPLFEATRRPRPVETAQQAAPIADAAVAPTSPAEELRVVGIMRPRSNGGGGPTHARVLLRSSDLPQAVWLETGASIGGWTVSAIGDRTVTVEAGGQRREISLFRPPASAAN